MSRSKDKKQKKSKSSTSQKTATQPASTNSAQAANGKASKGKVFPYRAMLGRCLAPAIPIKLLHRNGDILPATRAIVDSGADVSTFPGQWAAQMGIDLDADCQQRKSNTAGGEAINYFFVPGVDAIVMGAKVHLCAVFNKNLKVVLLGREDFFQEYRVSFDQRKKTFRVEPY